MQTQTVTQEAIFVDQHRLCFETLANGLRLEILTLLEREPQNVTQLAQATKAERSRVSHALQILRQCGLARAKKQGREVVYVLNRDTPVFTGQKGNLFELMEAHAKRSCAMCKRRGRKPFE